METYHDQLTTKALTELLMSDPEEFRRLQGIPAAAPPAPHSQCLQREEMRQTFRTIREVVVKPLTDRCKALEKELATERTYRVAIEEQLALLEKRIANLDNTASAHRKHLSNLEGKISTLIHGKKE